MQELIGVGYWHSFLQPTLPDPAWFVDKHWPATTRRSVVSYLRQGVSLAPWMGYSWCRFRCEAPRSQMGTSDLTDGTYCWPEGLAHYLVEHAVRLPDPVVQHILSQQEFPHGKAAQITPGSPMATTWWATQRGWQANAKSFASENTEADRNFVRRFDQGKIDFSEYSEADTEAIKRIVQQLRITNCS